MVPLPANFTPTATTDEQVWPRPRLHRLCGILRHGRTFGGQQQQQQQQRRVTTTQEAAKAAEGDLERWIDESQLEDDDVEKLKHR